MVVDPKGRFVYAIGWNDIFFSNNNVFSYQTQANGTLVPIPNSTVNLSDAPIAAAIDPTGSYFYLTTNAPALLAYHIEPDGTLKAIANVPFKLGEDPHQLAVDHGGKYVYVVGNLLYGFQLNQAGQLVPASGSPHKLGTFINGLRINPKANFLYAISDGRLFGFEILSTGNLRCWRDSKINRQRPWGGQNRSKPQIFVHQRPQQK
jgi:DNA-binding beta-propeller fold protein YncE